jgi:hypothetical protein
MASKKKTQAAKAKWQQKAGRMPTAPADACGQPADLPIRQLAAAADVPGSAKQAAATPVDDAETRNRRAFFGRSGHLAVMSEFLHRRINVAIPEVDVGDDVFVVKGNDEAVMRVQVKSATAKVQQNGYVATFTVPEAQLSVSNDYPSLVYVFAIRHGNRWSDFIVVRRTALFSWYVDGTGQQSVDENDKRIVRFRIVFTNKTAKCGPGKFADFQPYRNAWAPWPPMEPKGGNAPTQSADRPPASDQASG